jgi:hypothetical protein
MTDNHGYVLAPVPVAPVHETDMVLFPDGLKALKRVAKEVGLDLRGAYVNLDGGFDSRANRKCIFNAGMIPNIKENPRNRKRPIVFGTNFAGEAQERYGYTGGAFLHHLSLGEGDTYGLLCACARHSTKPPRSTVFSSPGAVVRPSACGWHHAGSGREPAVVL